MTARLVFIAYITLFFSGGLSAQITVQVSNKLEFKRNEVVAIPAGKLGSLLEKREDLRIRRKGSDINLPVQWVDMDGNGTPEELLFVADVPARSTMQYIVIADAGQPVPVPVKRTFSRFVPERTDDYAWENDRV
ncbi:MAG: DUF4861 domain-containing protein, partial [Sphingobacteriales bacterium]